MNQPFAKPPPPATHELRPELPDKVNTRLENLGHKGHGYVRSVFSGETRIKVMVSKIEALGKKYSSMTDGELDQEVVNLKKDLITHGLIPSLVTMSFALIREKSARILSMRHYPSQLEGGLVILQGMVAEMETGEGKTLTATLAAATAALAAIPVHVISVNDYLTARDAENMGPLYRSLGIQVGCVTHGMQPAEKRVIYSSDITYVTNKELVFDYLRDRLTQGNRTDPMLLQAEYLHSKQPSSKRLILRGLHFGIVDEADSILIDEARTPLIISGSAGEGDEQQFLTQALNLASGLVEKDDFTINKAQRQIRFTEAGRKKIETEAKKLGPLWSGLVRRESTVHKALMAQHFFHRDEQYLIRDGKIQIIDEFTGRVMEDRSWEQGLHQLIELKENCELTERRETLAKISYQRFFRRYLHLAGMTGTAREVSGELWTVYNLLTLKISTHRPLQRKKMKDRVFATEEAKWQATIERIQELHSKGQPVLIGTRSVSASERLSELAQRANLPHHVLNAKQDAEEAEIISKAGAYKAITIATNMAGRGTDIKLEQGIQELGGLHVIATERHEAARIDRQLAGRAGRQGDPGSYEALLSFDDLLLEGKRGGPVARMAKWAPRSTSGLAAVLARWAIHRAQKSIERYHARVRKDLFRQDQAQGSLLSFSGRLE